MSKALIADRPLSVNARRHVAPRACAHPGRAKRSLRHVPTIPRPRYSELPAGGTPFRIPPPLSPRGLYAIAPADTSWLSKTWRYWLYQASYTHPVGDNLTISGNVAFDAALCSIAIRLGCLMA